MLDRPTPDHRESGVTIGEAFAAALVIIVVVIGFAALIVSGCP